MRPSSTLATLVLGLLAGVGVAQTGNVTSLLGTWSSGSGAVVTGSAFADPMNAEKPFAYPANTGISYSFTEDGFFEEAQYRYNSNASRPDCPEAIVLWQHGKYTLHNNGSMTLDPSVFGADGRIQVQNNCASPDNVLTYYSQWELFKWWQIEIDLNHAAYCLQLWKWDGSKMPRLYLVDRPPTMLPTVDLTAIYNGSTQAIGGQIARN